MKITGHWPLWRGWKNTRMTMQNRRLNKRKMKRLEENSKLRQSIEHGTSCYASLREDTTLIYPVK